MRRMCAGLAMLAFGATSAVAISGCGDGGEIEEVATFYGSTGAMQCGPNPFTSSNVSALATRLANAGASVSAINCGIDGRIYPAVCGAPNDTIWLIQIAATSSEIMRSQGFSPLAELPGAREVPCG